MTQERSTKFETITSSASFLGDVKEIQIYKQWLSNIYEALQSNMQPDWVGNKFSQFLGPRWGHHWLQWPLLKEVHWHHWQPARQLQSSECTHNTSNRHSTSWKPGESPGQWNCSVPFIDCQFQPIYVRTQRHDSRMHHNFSVMEVFRYIRRRQGEQKDLLNWDGR